MNYTQKLSEIAATVENEFGMLDAARLNLKPNPDSWSIAQCIEHLIISNSKYFAVFESVLSGKHRMSFWEKNNPLTNYTGKQMIKTLGPVVIKKFQSPKLFQPSRSAIRVTIVKEFISHQEKLCTLFKKLNEPAFENIIITSPVAGLLTLKLRDAMEIVVAHEERHLMQMQRLIGTNN